MRSVSLQPIPVTAVSVEETVAEVAAEAPNGADVAGYLQAVVAGQVALYERTGASDPWTGYLAHDAATGELLGSCSFIVGDPGGSKEIAYFTFPPFEGQGTATAMGRELLAIAARAGDPDLHAFTLPEDNASTAILRKLGFVQAGDAHDEDAGRVWRWERRSGKR